MSAEDLGRRLLGEVEEAGLDEVGLSCLIFFSNVPFCKPNSNIT